MGSDKAIEGPPRDLTGVWKKVRGLEAGFEVLRSEVKSGLLFFKEEIIKLFSGKNTPRQDVGDDASSVISPTRTGVDCSEQLEEDSVEEEDDSLVEFKRRLSRIEE